MRRRRPNNNGRYYDFIFHNNSYHFVLLKNCQTQSFEIEQIFEFPLLDAIEKVVYDIFTL